MRVDRNKEIVRRIVDELLNSGDLSAFDELVHEDYRDGYEGFDRDEYKQLIGGVRSAFPDAHSAVDLLRS